MEKQVCAASDCDNPLSPTSSPHAKYCSDKCRWRDNKRKHYAERVKDGKCPQCGRKMELDIGGKRSYCNDCKTYFKDRYYENKNDL